MSPPIDPMRCSCTKARALAEAHPGIEIACRDCGSLLRAPATRPAPVTLAGLPAAPNEAPGAKQWHAKRELTALARLPRLRSASLEPAQHGHEGDTVDLGRELTRDQIERLALRADRRLGQMLARKPQGDRYACIVHYLYASRGPILDARESAAEAVVERFGIKHERLAFRRWMDTADSFKKLTPDGRDKLLKRAYGNALMDCAARAYECDEWRSPIPSKPQRWHERFMLSLKTKVEALRERAQGESIA